MGGFRIRPFRARQALQWFPCGWRLWRRRPMELLAPAAVFALAAILLREIPVIGDVLLLLILPSVATSYLIQVDIIARTGVAPTRKGAKGLAALDSWLRALRQTLFGAWADGRNVFPLLLVGFVLVVLGLIALALFTAIGGQAVVSPYGFFDLGIGQMLRLLLAYGVIGLFWLVVVALLQWTVPLFAIRDLALADALWINLRALARNSAAALLYLALMAAVFLPGAALKLWSPMASIVALWVCTVVVTVMFGVCGYCSFRLVFAEVQPSAPPQPAGRIPARPLAPAK
jgi:hypothetical protein